MQEAFQGVDARFQRARFNAGDGRLRRPGHLCELPLAEPGTAAGVAKQKSSATHASMIAKMLSHCGLWSGPPKMRGCDLARLARVREDPLSARACGSPVAAT
jgi:hypothetical protein